MSRMSFINLIGILSVHIALNTLKTAPRVSDSDRFLKEKG